MRAFMTLFAAGLMVAVTSTAFARVDAWGRTEQSYSTTVGLPAVKYYYRAPVMATAPATTVGTRSLSVEPGSMPTAMPTLTNAPTYRVARPHTPTWILPREQKYSTR